MSLHVISKCPTSTIKNLCICSRFRGLCLGTKSSATSDLELCGSFSLSRKIHWPTYCNHLQSVSNLSL